MESRFYSDHDSIKMERRCRMLSETFIENTSENTIESESYYKDSVCEMGVVIL